MSWRNQLPKEGTGPEQQSWGILSELGVAWEPTVWLNTIPAGPSWWRDEPCDFTAYPRHIDVVVENVLGIEVQSKGFHEKPKRVKKDRSKRKSIDALGLGWLEIWDYELEKACQAKAGKEWKTKVRELVNEMLLYSHKIHPLYEDLWSRLPEPPMIEWPGVGYVRIDRRNE